MNFKLDWIDKIHIVGLIILFALGVKELFDIIEWCIEHISLSIL